MNVVDNKWIGQRTIRPDGVDKVIGRAAYGADATMPNMIWGKELRSLQRACAHSFDRHLEGRGAAGREGV